MLSLPTVAIIGFFAFLAGLLLAAIARDEAKKQLERQLLEARSETTEARADVERLYDETEAKVAELRAQLRAARACLRGAEEREGRLRDEVARLMGDGPKGAA